MLDLHGSVFCYVSVTPSYATLSRLANPLAHRSYKKYIFTADGSQLLGGIMIGDTGAFTKMVSLIKKKKKLTMPPSEFIIGAKKEGEDDGGDLDDDAVICSCHVSSALSIARRYR